MLYNEIIFSSGWVDPCGWAGPVNLGPTMLYFEFLNIKCFNRTYGNHREISNKRNLKYVSVSIRAIYSNQNIIHTKNEQRLSYAVLFPCVSILWMCTWLSFVSSEAPAPQLSPIQQTSKQSNWVTCGVRRRQVEETE